MVKSVCKKGGAKGKPGVFGQTQKIGVEQDFNEGK